MKAITVTQELKDSNPRYFKDNSIGSIKQFRGVPETFKSLTYNEGKRTDGYHTLAESIHEADGFFTIVSPTYDTSIERLGGLFFDEPTQSFTYPIVALTQDEIDSNSEDGEENEARTQIDKHLFKGSNLVGKCERKIWRRRNKTSDAVNKLKQGEARSLKKWFTPVYQWLMLGNYQQAKLEIAKVITANQTDLDAVAGMINTATWLETEILDYFDNQYDL